jgi:hypothetical protein
MAQNLTAWWRSAERDRDPVQKVLPVRAQKTDGTWTKPEDLSWSEAAYVDEVVAAHNARVARQARVKRTWAEPLDPAKAEERRTKNRKARNRRKAAARRARGRVG